MNQVYTIITDRIISLLERGIVPWQRPWIDGLSPANYSSRRPYRGINQWLLNAIAQDKGYTSVYWITYKDAAARGGNVRKGEHGTMAILWKLIEKEDEDTGKTETVPWLRYYTVFNIQQCDGIPEPPAPEPREFSPIEAAEQIAAGYKNPPTINHSANGRAFYRRSDDSIHMPDREYFKSEAGYYATLFHEMIHSTGHESRLDRLVETARFGNEDYSKEELTAELGAAMLSNVAGIDPTLENSAAYIQSWLTVLKDDKTLIIGASARAQKAADYIQGITYEKPEAQPEPEPAAA